MFKSSKCPQNISMTFNYCKRRVGFVWQWASFNIGKIIKSLTGHFELTVR